MEQKKFSIIIAAHDQAGLLEANLQAFLSVAREANGEVIVVDDMSTDDTPDVLKRLKVENSDVLYSTFLPKSVVINLMKIVSISPALNGRFLCKLKATALYWLISNVRQFQQSG